MKKYNVDCMCDNAAQHAGEEPNNNGSENHVGDYIEADSPEEAISFALDHLAEQIRANNVNYDARINYDDETITVYDRVEDEVICHYYRFTTEER